MVLSDRDIKKAVSEKLLEITPWDEKMVQPASVDLHLGDNFLVFDSHANYIIDPKKDVKSLMKKIVVSSEEPLIVHPREFLLGTTVETIGIGNTLVGRLEGKSSLGRVGLIVHSTAGYIDPGFKGQITLEITNLANIPIALYPGMKVCQISFSKLSSEVEVPYGAAKLGSHYQGQVGTTSSDLSGVIKNG